MLCMAATVPLLHADIIVSGNSTALFGGNWTTNSSSANKMGQYGSTDYYYLLKSNVSLPGNLEYKVVDNGAWYGDNGNNVSLTATGTHTVVFVYNKTSHKVRHMGSFQTIIIAGSDTQALGSSWNGNDTNNKMTTTDGYTYTLAKSATYSGSSSQSFKTVVDGTWYGDAGDNNGNNIYYSIPEAGDYDITYTFNAITGMSSVSVVRANVPTYDYTFYVYLPNGGTPHLYLWNGSNNPNGGWPGAQMTQTERLADGNYWYKVNVTCEYTTLNVIVDLGNGANQSADITNLAPGTYYITWDGGNRTTADVSTNAPTAPPVPDYYVVGDETLVGHDWATANDTKMNESSGVYTWSKNGIHLTAGNYSLKVLGSDNSWHGNANDGGDVVVTANANGTYNLQVTFDPVNDVVTATLNLTQADPVYTYNIYVRYTGNEPVSNVFLYAWDGAGTLSDGWDSNNNIGGTALSALTAQTINGYTYYTTTYTSYSSTIGVIFNENGSSSTQTANLAGQPGDNYYTYGGGSSCVGPTTSPDAEIVITYYVKGDDTNIFPNGWDSDSNTAMTDNEDGTYSWLSGQFHLNAGTEYTYKVWGDDNTWHPSNVGGNMTFSNTVAGTYTVTITYDSNNETVTAVLNLIQEDPVYTYDIYVRYKGNEPIENVFLYAWDGVGDLSDAWDSDNHIGGTSLADLTSQVINGHTYYHVTYTSYTSAIGMVLNENGDGSTKTDNLSVDPGTSYFTYGGGNIISYASDTADPAIVYYIVGDASVFPNGWNTGDGTALTDNGNGTYSWNLPGNVHLNAGTNYPYKVLTSEGVYYPSGDNESFSVNTPGTYTISATFDGTTPVVTATLVQADAMSYSVVGSKELFGGNEDWANQVSMTDDNDGTYSWDSQDLVLNAGTYYFKVKDNYGGWYGTAGSDNGDNIEVHVAANGTYRLHIDFDGSNAPTYTLVRVDLSTIYITGSESLGLGWSPAPTTTMTYDVETGLYAYSFDVVNAGTHAFVFATGQGSGQDDEAAWYDFNTHYRVGPTNGDENVTLNGDWAQTQQAGGNNGAYMVTTGVGKYTIYYDPTNVKYKVVGPAPIFITGDLGLGLGWSYAPTTAMAYNDSTGLYSYTYRIPNQGTYSFVFANGQATGFEEDHGGAWNYFNTNYRIGPTSGDQTVTIGQWENTQAAGGDNGAYSVRLAAGYVTIYFDNTTSPMRFKVESGGELGEDLYMVGTMTYDNEIYHYAPNQGILMKYDNAKKLYYLNHVTINTNSTFCFSTSLGDTSEDWQGMGTRYGNNDNDPNYFVAHDGDATAHLRVTGDKINVNMPLDVWDEDLGEWMMNTAGVYNVIVNLEDGWVKLIKTDQFSLFPMNVYLQQTDNVEMDPGTIGHTYNITDDGSNPWPLIAWNRLEGDWNPQENEGANHYSVTYMGDTTTTDGKTWWHWQVSASIAEIIFTRTNMAPYQSETIARKAGVLWYTWEQDNTMTAHSREYFTSSATQLPGNVEVEEGHYYVYFINTVGWETVYCVAWSSQSEPYYDGHGKDVQTWPGQPMVCIGIDPKTGYEVWEYDFGAIDDSQAPDDLLFHDGTPIATTDAKEQTGDFDFINGGVYDYLGLFDDAYTLNSLIRTAEDHIRYTVSNDLVGVYYDPDAVTPVSYPSSNGTIIHTTVTGALYAKDLNDYGEKSIKPDGDEYTDYVYEICNGNNNDGRPSQIMDKKEEYDQSNWIKLVISPNYDGGNPYPIQAPSLKQYEDHIIPAGTLQLYMTDQINPTARVVAIQAPGEYMKYEPNVYVSAHFNDTVVFNYTHREWQPDAYSGTYRTKPTIEWQYDEEGDTIYGKVTRTRVEDKLYKMFYVAPKPQEIAYLTWMVYDNPNEDDAWPGYDPDVYMPYTRPNINNYPPDSAGWFFSPKNWDRSEEIPYSYFQQLIAAGKMTQDQLAHLADDYLSNDQMTDILGGYGKAYGPYTNGYMQYGAVDINWSLFDPEADACEGQPWWYIFRPGQAYKFKAIIRYARGSEEGNNTPYYCFGPSSGLVTDNYTVYGAPRREDPSDYSYQDTFYPNMYKTNNYKNMDQGKFIIFPIEASPEGSNGSDMGNVTTVKEVVTARTVVGTKYYNLMGVESSRPFEGINIVVTFYSDGSRTSKKILR